MALRFELAVLNATTADQPFFFSTSTMPGAGNASDGSHRHVSSKMAGDDDLVQRARKEISEIVREVAALSRQPLDQAQFFAALLDRIICAIAAEGAVLWDCQAEKPQVLTRVGRVTDSSIAPTCTGAHVRLLQEIVQHQSPVVVPSTPDAADSEIPANPTAFPAALVPIIDLAMPQATPVNPREQTGPRFLLEVFLEGEAGVATQRGYLRFVVQMADLASEFLRNDEIRRARLRADLHAKAMRSLTVMHSLQTSTAMAAQLVDDAAEMMNASRVTLAAIHAGRAKLIAISHVDRFDTRGAACKQLAQTIVSLKQPLHQLAQFDALGGASEIALSQASQELPGDAPLSTVWIIRNADDSLRMLFQDAVPKSRDALQLETIEQWAQQALALLESRRRFESVPLAKAYVAISPALTSVSPSTGRRMVTILAGMLVLGILAFIPTPMIVSVPATLRPAGVQTYYAPSDVVIESVAVVHRQAVQPGDVLMQLRDWSLDEQITTLTARRALITQRLARSLASLVEAPGNSAFARGEPDATRDEDLVQQQRLLEEELAGVDEQLELLSASRERLTIRAKCEGLVDAWQTELTAQGRPVKRGEALFRIEPIDAPWMVDAKVPQSRLSAVMNRFREQPGMLVNVATAARPDQSFEASFVRRQEAIAPTQGPLSTGSAAREGSLGIELQLSPTPAEAQALIGDEWTNGTPAMATIDCGRLPLAQVMFFDLFRAARRALSRWI